MNFHSGNGLKIGAKDGRKKNKAAKQEAEKRTVTRNEIFNILFGVEESQAQKDRIENRKNAKTPVQGEDVETV